MGEKEKDVKARKLGRTEKAFREKNELLQGKERENALLWAP